MCASFLDFSGKTLRETVVVQCRTTFLILNHDHREVYTYKFDPKEKKLQLVLHTSIDVPNTEKVALTAVIPFSEELLKREK